MKLNAWASDSHYADHLAPVWLALPEERRGVFYMVAGPRVPPALAGRDDVWVSRERPHGPDPVLVASYADYLGVRPAPVIFVEHGAGQTYGDANSCYAGGADRDRVVLFLCPNEEVAARNSARYPGTPAAVVGSPFLDAYHDRRARPMSGMPTVAISFHWDCLDGSLGPEGRSAFAYYEPVLAKVASAFPGAIGHAHPRWYLQVVSPLVRAGFRAVRYFDQVMDEADLYVCDNSSTLFEFASTDRPVVLLNAPWYRRDVELGRRFWRDADVGLQADTPAELIDVMHRALEDPLAVAENRRAAVARVYAHTDGRASARAAEAVTRRLDELEA